MGQCQDRCVRIDVELEGGRRMRPHFKELISIALVSMIAEM